MVTDPIADFLIRLKNASRAKREKAVVPYSKMKAAMADVLVREGYLKSVEEQGKKVERRSLSLELSYPEKGVAKITEVKRVSKPGRRVYSSSAELRYNRHSITVVSTSAGLMTTKEAKKQKLGGELLFTISS